MYSRESVCCLKGYLYCEQNADRNMNATGASGNDLAGNEELAAGGKAILTIKWQRT